MFFRPLTALLLATGIAAGPALAHHSFAVFFDSEKMVSITGQVREFHFKNPHGLIRLAVRDEAGGEVIWTAETNSPSLLRRRGWTPESLTPGETVRVQGWAARDGSRYVRMRAVQRADGTPVGEPLEFLED